MSSLLLHGLLSQQPSAINALNNLNQGSVQPAHTSSAGSAASLDFDNPYDNLYAFGKIWAGYDKPQIGAFHGLMYGRIGDARLVPLFGYTGTGVMQSKIDDDGNMQIRGKETGYFTDLASGDILETWDNPWTGDTVEVFNFYNPNMGGKLTAQMPRFAMGATKDDATLMNEGTHIDQSGTVPFVLPFEVFGDDLMLAWDYAHEYTNPVSKHKWPKACTGNRISPSEHFTFSMSLEQMMDRSQPTVRYQAGFSRLSQWWPWMRMGEHKYKDEVLFGRIFSHKGLTGYDDVPPKVLAYIEKHAPEFLEVPDYWPEALPKGTWEAFAEEVPPEV
ncbi:MAG: DUF1838 domain-containing protein [Gammaproteobacteria bacterium]|nr:DUF1838 domain-containing protein [Gammaproteobacteria bacterium]MCP4090731.1 DUF1838 domain-containing protein [Gammaproteobacteria bacterium]MCP4277158.1 DUF1838 domain-containing protein [Gammaproteobacteria bacterium]MCP4831708.1 DUF1838 domain-containing protein [Gammaproteobacteria bacterium]MCP4928032.1 DUF1838 domain-containing protein [Gammaproteobacteria bacterium]